MTESEMNERMVKPIESLELLESLRRALWLADNTLKAELAELKKRVAAIEAVLMM